MGKDFPYMDENGSISKTNILREKRIRTPTQIYASTKLVTAFEGTKDKKAQKKLDTFKKRQKANAKRGKKSKACFKWLGKPVSTRYDEEHDDRITRYKTFEFDDTIYRKGTSVHLRNARKPTMPHVGLILDCFEAETDGLQYVRVQWFLRDNELPKSLRAMVKKKQTVETALIIDATRNVADMLAEELVEAVMVCPAWEHKPPQPRIAEVADSIESDGSSPVCKTPARNVRAERSVEEDEDDVPKYYVQFTYDADNKSVAELTRDTYASWKLEVFKHAEVKEAESGAEDDAADDEDYKVTADESDDSGSEGEVESDGQSLAQEDDEDSDEDKPICSKRKRVTTRRKRTRKRKAPRPRAKPKTPGVSKTKKQKIMEGLAKTINDRANRRDNTSTIAGAEEDVYEKARRMLHVSAVPDNLPCRENEFAEIYGFAEGHITGRESGSMYISGVPGTGKTATVHEVMRQLKSSADEGDLPEFKFVEINGMQLTDIMQAYTQIWKGLTDDKVTPKQALDNLKRYFTTPSPRKECIVLLVDELDQLISTQHSVMYEIFSWPMSKHARLVVLTIANTMDLPERLLTNKEASRLGMNRVTFEPYTHEQLKIIVTSRLENLVVFKPEAIELCARKIAATSGDARRCLDICRAATEMAQERAEGELKKVGIPEIDAVIKRMHKNTTVVSVRNSSWQQQLFLVSLLQVLKRSGMEEARLHQIIGQFLKICKSHSFNSPSESQISGIARVLSAMRVIHSEPCVTDFHRRIRLNTDATAVDMALRQDKTLKKILSGSVV